MSFRSNEVVVPKDDASARAAWTEGEPVIVGNAERLSESFVVFDELSLSKMDVREGFLTELGFLVLEAVIEFTRSLTEGSMAEICIGGSSKGSGFGGAADDGSVWLGQHSAK